jgi:large subunit ribosomal protein L25
METIVLIADARPNTGKQAVQKTRQAGKIPAVVYGAEAAPRTVEVVDAELQRLLRASGNHLSLLNLKVKEPAGEVSETVIIKAIQRHAVREHITHIDFQRVAMNKPFTLDIPVEITGVAPGVKLGGVLQQMVRHIRVRCLPALIPRAATADVSKMEIGHVLFVKDLGLPEGVERVTDSNQAVVSVTVTHYEEETATPAAGAEGAPAEAATAAQPEVIGEKEREERKLKKDDEKGAREKEKTALKEVKAKEEKKK